MAGKVIGQENVPVTTTPARRQLLEILRGPALKRLPKPVRLASGAWSSHFFDGKEALAKWNDLQVACEAIKEAVGGAGHSFDAVGGLTMGADAIAVGVAAVSDTAWFSVRKEPKKRGTNRLIEGAQIGPGWKVLLVDDVVTTGGSIVKAYDAVTQSGAEIVAAVTLVDRGDSARMYFGNLGVAYFPMATYRDLGIDPVRPPLDKEGPKMNFEAINPEGMCEPPEPYSYAVRAGDTVYLAGQVAFDADGAIVGETTGEQAEQIWKNIAEVLEACGGTLANVVKITYYCQDIRELPEEMEVRRRVFGDGPYPAVTACQAAALGLPGLKLEVDVIAVIPQ